MSTSMRKRRRKRSSDPKEKGRQGESTMEVTMTMNCSQEGPMLDRHVEVFRSGRLLQKEVVARPF